jgi:23S rRNA pseudouridine1911/1915/1917 synthase
MNRAETFQIPALPTPTRLDSYVTTLVPELSRAAVQRLIETGHVHVDSGLAKPSLKLVGGETVTIVIPPPVAAEPMPQAMDLDILYEDSDLIVINKAAGMTVHPGAGTHDGTLVNALLAHCTDLSGIGGVERPGIVHRIDKDTSGILVVAKNDRSHQALSDRFQRHDIKRIYHALIYGSPRTDSGTIRGIIGRHPTDRVKMSGKAKTGKPAATHWRVEARYPEVSLVRLRLETGRTHQIRVHLSEAGHPLLGDPVYGSAGRINTLKDQQLRRLVKELGRQALHASTLGFVHPTNNEFMEFTTPLPEDMQRILTYLDALVTADHDVTERIRIKE